MSVKIFQWDKELSFQQIVPGQLDSHKHKFEVKLLPRLS